MFTQGRRAIIRTSKLKQAGNGASSVLLSFAINDRQHVRLINLPNEYNLLYRSDDGEDI